MPSLHPPTAYHILSRYFIAAVMLSVLAGASTGDLEARAVSFPSAGLGRSTLMEGEVVILAILFASAGYVCTVT